MKANPVTETKTTPTNSLRFTTQPNSEAVMQTRLQQQRKNLQKGESNIALIYSCIGVIRSKWYNKNHQLMTFSYGTAFQVSPRILITCTHNIFSRFRSTWAHEVEFVPGVDQGVIQDYYKNVRRSLGFQGKLDMETYKKEPLLKDCVSFENSPQNYEVSLVVLQERADQQKNGLAWRSGEKQELCQIEDKKNIERGQLNKNTQEKYISLREYSLTELLPLTIIGYPSQRFRTCMRFDKAYVKRSLLNNLPYLSKTQEKDNVIHYRIPTSVGMSGSPILVCDGNTYSAIGIHTHRGQEPGYNSGIYFDKGMIERIKELEAKIEMNEKIVYPINYVDRKNNEKQKKNDEDTPSPQEYHQKENSSKVNSPIDEYALPLEKDLNDQQYLNCSDMSDQIDEPSQMPEPQQTPKRPNQCEIPQQSSQSSDWSNTSEMSQLDDIYKFFSIVKEPLCDSQPISPRAQIHSCDLSKLSIASRLSPYSNLLAQIDHTGSKIAHF